MALQSSSATLENYLPAMDYLLGLFEEAKEQYKDDSFMASRVNSTWSKLDKYYTKTSESPAYIAALVLDPSMKWEYINSTWPIIWRDEAKLLVTKLWKKYRPTNTATNTMEVQAEDKDKPNPNVFTTWKHQKSNAR